MNNTKRPVVFLVDNEIDSETLRPLVDFLNNEYTLLKSGTIEDAEIKFKYDTESIDMVILDIHFGNNPTGGIKLLEKMRKTDPDLPIGMITQYDESLRAFESGQKLATFYLPKPTSGINDNFLNELNRSIRHSLGNTSYLYDRDLMKRCNSMYADTYDEEEYSKPGTVAFCYWEDTQIIKTIENFVSENPDNKLKILDIGCGTGRFEILLKKFFNDKAVDYKITALDFAGKMLLKAKEKIEDNLEEGEVPPEPADFNDIPKIKLERGFAEKLPFENNSFNFAIAAFGIPAYTQFNLTIPEIYRVLEKGGVAIFTVYSKNALFHKISDFFFPHLENECPLASWVIKERLGKTQDQWIYKLAPQGDVAKAFPIQTFTKAEFKDMLNRFKFEVIKSGSFPVLTSLYPVSYINFLTKNNVRSYIPIVEYIPKRKTLVFSWKLFESDLAIAKNIDDEGYYITAIARKR
jgi:ubiquinone/menaquinone biosynthesis C-methylase UbiE/DNA-binding NarL/FixJ family response regulator